MIQIDNYKIISVIHEHSRATILKAIRITDSLPVILKVLNDERASLDELAMFKHEYEVLRSIDLEGIIKVYDLIRQKNHLILVLEDFNGKSLNYIPFHRLQLSDKLDLSIKIITTIGELHSVHIIHKNINPSNIVLNIETGVVKIIDLSLSSVLIREQASLTGLNILRGSLPYMAPEQTGRMNRFIDYRTDFYSFGVILYELLTHSLPFETNDPLELVHCHIARQPIPPHRINPDIPEILSHITLNLMAKNAEDRYQSAWGIKSDLENCLNQLQTKGEIQTFDIGKMDIPDRFQVSQKLYGREKEIQQLLDTFNRLVQPNDAEDSIEISYTPEVVLVTGYSGIGKSALVKEIYKPITKKRGYFVSGKFDQFHQRPYSAVLSAFTDLVKLILTESENDIQKWRDKFQKALGKNAQVIIDVIPEMELIIGKQPETGDLPPEEAQNRFHFVLQNFFSVFATIEHPLVIFLDDLQWIDSASLKLIQLLFSSKGNVVLLIGAYRDNEVNAAHPLMITIEELIRLNIPVNYIVLTPLQLIHIQHVIAQSLKCTLETALPLAELVLEKTDGNPFFMNEFLKSLYDENLLHFDLKHNCWKWELSKIQSQDITDNVVELMAGKIKKLKTNTQDVLKLAACIGNQFNLETLSVVYENSHSETLSSLWEAITEGLVLPIIDVYKSIDLMVWSGLEESEDESSHLYADQYKFSHDRIQQAAYSLIPVSEKEEVHWHVGTLLKNKIPPEKHEQRIFDIVNQLNIGVQSLTGSVSIREIYKSKLELASFNLIAGKRAKLSAAYDQAYKYLKIGIDMLDFDSWINNYQLTLSLYLSSVECAYLCTRFDEMESFAKIVISNSRKLLDKSRVYEIQILAYRAQNKMPEAVRTALKVLKLYGIKLPDKPNKLNIILGFIKTKYYLSGKTIEDLEQLPPMTDPISLAAVRIISCVGSAFYSVVPELVPMGVFQVVTLSVTYGNDKESAFDYAAYGLILCGVIGDIETGYQFGTLALRLVDQSYTKEVKARTWLLVYDMITHWKEHVQNTLSPLLEAYQIGLENGDLEFASLSILVYCYHSYFVGKELPTLSKEMKKYGDAIHSLKQEAAYELYQIYHQTVLNLMGESKDPTQLTGDVYDETIMIQRHQQVNDKTALCQAFFNRAILCYLFHNYKDAFTFIIKAEQYLDGVTGMLVVPLFYFYDALIRIAIYPEATQAERVKILFRIRNNQKRMKRWAHFAPMNHLHKYYLVEAEKNRILNHDALAIKYYDRAIEHARENSYINEEALANELTAIFFMKRGMTGSFGVSATTATKAYLMEASYCYLRWGAMAKISNLEKQYPNLLTKLQPNDYPLLYASNMSTLPDRANILDLMTAIKASQAIASEIMMDKLLVRLMKIVFENAGAQSGVLILEDNDKLLIEASGQTDQFHVEVLQSIPIEQSDLVPVDLIHFVVRTKEYVIINDASKDSKFINDLYIQKMHPKSILCAPIIHKGNLLGVLYLENNLTQGAFTSERIEMIKLLSSHIASSIENARLHANLEKKAEKVRRINLNLKKEIQERISAQNALAQERALLAQRVEERTKEIKRTNEKLLLEISERKRTEEQLRVAKEIAEAANLAKSEFLSNMSHEFRTPMHSILSFSNFGIKRIKTATRDKLLRYFENIKLSGERLLPLLNDLLDLSKLEAGMMDYKMRNHDLFQLAKTIAAEFSHLATEKDITIQLIQPDFTALAFCDNIKICQVIRNFLSNAVKFTLPITQITLSLHSDIREINNEQHEYTQLKVMDQGVGIPENELERVFDKFVQSSLTKTGAGGTGLGLAICKEIITDHKGYIWAENNPKGGAAFFFSIPSKEILAP